MERVQAQILDKVKKLLALATSPSEAEAAAAMAKASVLLAKYGLSMAEVQQEADVQEAVLLAKQRMRAWESALVAVISKATFTEALHYRDQTGGRLLLIGREVNIVTAKELFRYLHQQILVLGRTHSAKIAHVESFRQGLVQRLGERLGQRNREEQASDNGYQYREDEKALILKAGATAKAENQQFIRQKYGKTTTKKTGRRLDADSFYHGQAVGNTVNLDQQIAKS